MMSTTLRPPRESDSGFTLVELLITVVIIAILTAIAVPAYITVVANAQDSAAKQSLKAISSAQDLASTTSAMSGQSKFLSSSGLQRAGLLAEAPRARTATNIAGDCYVSVARSEAGTVMYSTNLVTKPRTLTDQAAPGCVDQYEVGVMVAATGGKSATDATTVLVYDTSLIGANLVELPISSVTQVTVDWGDGSAVEKFTADHPRHTYAGDRPYTVKIDGTYTGLGYAGAQTAPVGVAALTEVRAWPEQLTDARLAFYNASNLIYVPSNLPSKLTNLNGMFLNASKFNGAGVESWNTGEVRNLSAVFAFNQAFNRDIGGWDTSNVVTLMDMFQGASVFNQPIGSWNTGKVVNSASMFRGAPAFNQPLGDWDTREATNMNAMFIGAAAFNQNIRGWNVARVFDTANFRTNSALTPENSPFG